jgi:hypothetical protein
VLGLSCNILSTTHPDHVINIINRDQRTPIFEPDKWNEHALVVDAWAGHVYTKKELPLICEKYKNCHFLEDSIDPHKKSSNPKKNARVFLFFFYLCILYQD